MVLILAGLLLAGNFLTSLSCDDGWIKYGSYCYFFSHNKVTWPDGEDICKVFGGKLAEPFTQPVNNFLSGQSTATGRRYWLGGADIGIEGEWKWVIGENHSQTMSYTNWDRGQPDNYHSGEDCLMINYDKEGRWNDMECERYNYYICQKDYAKTFTVIG